MRTQAGSFAATLPLNSLVDLFPMHRHVLGRFNPNLRPLTIEPNQAYNHPILTFTYDDPFSLVPR